MLLYLYFIINTNNLTYEDSNYLAKLISIVKVYDLATDKTLLVKEQSGKSGIYMFTNKINGKQYVGSAVNFGSRFSRNYYSNTYLCRKKIIL